MHVMLDLETFGTAAGSVIRSIGAVVFNPDGGYTGAEFYSNIDKQSCLDVGLKIDPATEKWWAGQSKEAQASLAKEPLPLAHVVRQFNTWWGNYGGQYVWSQGSNFDGPLWEAACRAVKMSAPWKFYNTRDTRTIYDVFGLDTRTITRVGTYHNALDDAKYQARCVQIAIAKGRAPAVVAKLEPKKEPAWL